jgi:hypothetical protein
VTAPTAAPPQQGSSKAPAKGGKQQQQVVVARRFRVGVQSHDENVIDTTVSTAASTTDLPVANISPAGWLRHFYLLLEATTASNAATVTFAENGPWNAIDTISLEDVNSVPVLGPLTGYELMIANKFGGYTHSGDPRQSNIFTTTAGVGGGLGGSFTWVLRIPVELVSRDALGPLPNKSGTAQFKVRIRLSATATIYGVAPTNAPSIRVRLHQVDWWDPPQTDLKGRPLAQQPPAAQTTQFWSKATFTLPSGAFRQDLERVGYGIRNLIFIYNDTGNGTRATGDTDFPDPATLQFEANVLMQGRPRRLWQHAIAEDYGYNGTTADAGGAREAGVYPLPFNKDFGLKPGEETRRGYLWTSSGSRLTFSGNNGGAATMTVLTNDVLPAGGNDAAIVA